METLESWELKNGHLEPWEFGRPGWMNERLSAHIMSPVKDQLTTEALAWTPGTNGPITARVFHLVPPDRPISGELTAFLESLKDIVKGKIVLAGRAVAAP